MNISLAFTTYNSFEFILKQIEKNYFSISGGIIDEIVIQDDFSKDFELLKPYVNDKIKIYQNEKNLSPLLSRPNLVTNCKNKWVLLMDSDNFLDFNSFEKIKSLNLKDDTIYCPDYARPNFQFKVFSDKKIDFNYVLPRIDNLDIQIFLNTGNYLVPKKQYLEISEKINPYFSHYTVDVIYYNYLWLSSGNNLYCVKDYEYDHTIRGDSYWATQNHLSKDKLNEVNNLFKK